QVTRGNGRSGTLARALRRELTLCRAGVGEDREVSIRSEPQAPLRTLEAESRNGKSQDTIRLFEDGSGRVGSLEQGFAHADELGALAGEQQREFRHLARWVKV